VIIIIENGQFGNQLFQFNFCLNLVKPNEKIFFIGFNDLSKFIKKNKKFFFIKNNNLIIKSIVKFRPIIVNILSKLRIIKTIIQHNNRNSIQEQKGLLNFVAFLEGHFENEKYINKNFKQYIKESKIEVKAKKFLKHKKKILNKKFFLYK
jgi:hypothetical protein